MGVLTVRENVMFSAELRLPLHLSKAEKQERADNVINLLVSQPSSSPILRGIAIGAGMAACANFVLQPDPLLHAMTPIDRLSNLRIRSSQSTPYRSPLNV
jgi:hypothetical protein